MASSREFALYFLVSLFSCFDHFMGVFDYSVRRSMLSCYHGVHGQRRRAFCSDTMLLFTRSIGTLIYHGKHRQTHGKLRQTMEWLLSLTMKNLKRARHLEYRKCTNKHIVDSPCQPCLVWMDGGRQRFDGPNHWRQWDNSPSQSWDFEYHWQGWT